MRRLFEHSFQTDRRRQLFGQAQDGSRDRQRDGQQDGVTAAAVGETVGAGGEVAGGLEGPLFDTIWLRVDIFQGV